MHNLKKLYAVVLILFTSLMISNSYAMQTDKNKNLNYLFIQSATWGTIKAGKEANTYLITLHDVQPNVTYFTDRPNRITGSMPTDKFLTEWKKTKNYNDFSQDAPNVGIEGVKLLGSFDDKSNMNLIMALSNPVYNAKKQQLTYTAKPLSGAKIDLKHHVIFRHVQLFFDDVNGICWSCT